MKKIFQISLIAFSTLFLAACTLKPASNDSNQNQSQTTKEENKKMSLKDLVNLGIAQKCTWSFEEEGNKMTGQILIKGKKFNQVSKITGLQGLIEFNSVSDGEYVYSWSDDPATGGMAFKMKIEDSQMEAEIESNPGQMNWDNQYDYSCNPTILSDSDFNRPQGMDFMDLNDLKGSFSIEE